jgi:hypothetical protein
MYNYAHAHGVPSRVRRADFILLIIPKFYGYGCRTSQQNCSTMQAQAVVPSIRLERSFRVSNSFSGSTLAVESVLVSPISGGFASAYHPNQTADQRHQRHQLAALLRYYCASRSRRPPTCSSIYAKSESNAFHFTRRPTSAVCCMRLNAANDC